MYDKRRSSYYSTGSGAGERAQVGDRFLIDAWAARRDGRAGAGSPEQFIIWIARPVSGETVGRPRGSSSGGGSGSLWACEPGPEGGGGAQPPPLFLARCQRIWISQNPERWLKLKTIFPKKETFRPQVIGITQDYHPTSSEPQILRYGSKRRSRVRRNPYALMCTNCQGGCSPLSLNNH